jgi:hypothetical protein
VNSKGMMPAITPWFAEDLLAHRRWKDDSRGDPLSRVPDSRIAVGP